MHAHDPQWEPHVIEENGPPSHHYDRWQGWTSDDPRWQVLVLDTTLWTEQQTIDALIDWVQLARTKPALLSPATRWWKADHR